MIDLDLFLNQPLIGGFIIEEIVLSHEPIEDALGRDAIAHTRIVGRGFRLTIRANQTEEELSITLYHEILEGATVASEHPPEIMIDFNEAGFERAAKQAFHDLGPASLENLNRMLQFYGFGEE